MPSREGCSVIDKPNEKDTERDAPLASEPGQPWHRLWKPALVVLALLTLALGFMAIGTLNDKKEALLRAEVRQGQSQLLADLLAVVEEAEQHTTFLSRHPEIERLVTASLAERDERRGPVAAMLLPYLVSFSRIDGLRVLDAEGRPLLAAIRQGQGVGLLPPERFRELGHLDDERFGAPLAGSGVQVSPIEFDPTRVEVPPEDRRYIYLRAAILDQERQVAGQVVLTVYAAPILKAVRRFQPISGSRTFLYDGEQRLLDLDPQGEDHRRLLAQLDMSDTEARNEDGDRFVLMRSPALGELMVVTLIPAAVWSRSVASVDSEVWLVLAALLLVLGLLGLVALFSSRSLAREQRLRETEGFLERIRMESARYKSILEGAADMILVVEPGGRILELNHAATKDLGLARDGAAFASLIDEAERSELQLGMQEALAEPGRVIGLSQLQVRGSGGETVTVEARLVAMATVEGPCVQISLRDRSEEVEIERRLRVADRLGSLGLLTAGVAHEINNPLAAIGNYLSLLKKPELGDEQRLRYADLIHHGFQRIGDIVRDLLRFARPNSATGRADLKEVVERCLSLIEFSENRSSVEISCAGLDEAVLVQGDAGGLEQVLLNLLLNALRALKDGGQVWIRARRDEGRGIVVLVVEDDGPGIPAEFMERVFDPFFTMSGGTGLGLSVSYGTMQAMGGSLGVEDRPEGGARFTMTCPSVSTDEIPNREE